MDQDMMMPFPIEDEGQEQPVPVVNHPCLRLNPRLVFTDPDDFFGRDFHEELIMEQCEQM